METTHAEDKRERGRVLDEIEGIPCSLVCTPLEWSSDEEAAGRSGATVADSNDHLPPNSQQPSKLADVFAH